MKNVIISICIFSAMCIFIIYANNKLSSFCNEITMACDELEESFDNNQWDICYENALQLHEKINKENRTMSVFMNHQEIDIVSFEVYRLTQYAKEMESGDFLASIHTIKHQVEKIMDLQKIKLENIF